MENEVGRLLNSILQNGKEIQEHLSQVTAGNQKCRGCKIPVDIVIPLAGLQPSMEKFLEAKTNGLMLGNQAFKEILEFWGKTLKKLEAHGDRCSKDSVGK